jgi:hypothetical protein
MSPGWCCEWWRELRRWANRHPAMAQIHIQGTLGNAELRRDLLHAELPLAVESFRRPRLGLQPVGRALWGARLGGPALAPRSIPPGSAPG